MAGKSQYTEDQKQVFVDRASQIGMAPAMQELGYPESKATASRWTNQMGVRITVTALQRHASQVKAWYGHAEKMTLLQLLLDKALDLLVYGEPDYEKETVTQDPLTGAVHVDYERMPCTAATIQRLSSTVQRTIQTMELLEGRATERSEQIGPDTTDVELASMIREFKAKNAVAESLLKEVV